MLEWDTRDTRMFARDTGPFHNVPAEEHGNPAGCGATAAAVSARQST